MTDTRVTLGDFVFAGFEVPERLPFGGEQALTVHELVGGARVVDAMGRRDMPIEWSGTFLGPDALARAQYLNTQRVIGQALLLTWSQLRFTVVIQNFEADFQFASRIPYKICCTVIADQATPTTAGAVPGIDDQISGDMAAAAGYGASIGDGVLSGLLSGLDTAIGAVSTFANAAQATINSVLQPIAAVQARVGILIAAVTNTAQNVSTVGGLLPNTPLAQSVATLGGQVVAYRQQPALFGLQNVLGRMSANLGTVAGNAHTAPVAGGNLFAVAAQQYGDATSWTGIAKASGLTDPMLGGLQTLVIPGQADTAGGVLGQ